jgi:cyclopropane-fatty-acyl-phospholipid synthase
VSLLSSAIQSLEAAPLPDALTRMGVAHLVNTARRGLEQTTPGAEAAFAADMDERPVAEFAEVANAQHYELPPEFFAEVLGPRRKYSCAWYDTPSTSLAEAEEAALERTAAMAELGDGQDILELGCGWGSLSLWMAERYPASRVTAVSNSAFQRLHIESEAHRRGLGNLKVITADMNAFAAPGRFDRIVSVEMFEHMANWRALLTRVRNWLRADGKLFIHVFTHRTTPYRFEVKDRSDWIAQHFFTGGIMPSHGLIGRFPDLFELEADVRWSGEHYQRTALDWLANYDRNIDEVDRILRRVYGPDTALWRRRWRLFFLATAGLFGCQGGQVWGVSHYRLRPVAADGLLAAE